MSYLFRAVLPSWKFFEDYGESPVLYYRLALGEQGFGGWERCLERPQRRWKTLFLNSRVNELLAYGSLLQHLVHDLAELGDQKVLEVEQSVSYQLVKNLVAQRVSTLHGGAEVVQYQFKVSVVDDVLISPTYEA